MVRTNDFRWVPTDYRHYGSFFAHGNETQGGWRLAWLIAQRGLLTFPGGTPDKAPVARCQRGGTSSNGRGPKTEMYRRPPSTVPGWYARPYGLGFASRISFVLERYSASSFSRIRFLAKWAVLEAQFPDVILVSTFVIDSNLVPQNDFSSSLEIFQTPSLGQAPTKAPNHAWRKVPTAYKIRAPSTLQQVASRSGRTPRCDARNLQQEPALCGGGHEPLSANSKCIRTCDTTHACLTCKI